MSLSGVQRMRQTLFATTVTAALSVALLAACSREPAPALEADPSAPAAEIPVVAGAETPADVAPATGGSLRVAAPADGAVTFAGFGPARFGGTAEEVRMAWGGDLGQPQPDQPGGCYYLIPQPQGPDGYQTAFMIEGDKFARVDVTTPAITAPGGGKVGMTKAEIAALYPGRIEERPHKYSDGEYLRIKDAAGGNGVLVFATDAKADTAKVTEWRVGVPPQVDYVEGCS